MLKDEYYRAKVIQVECNHYLPPPISYRDMCKQNAYGQSGAQTFDVFGCSVQAAYDVLRPYGYRLLQYDWPDATFVSAEAAPAFPCVPLDAFEANYWLGYWHAREHFIRFPRYANSPGFVLEAPRLAERAKTQPVEVLSEILLAYGPTWSKRPLWIELGVTGTNVGLSIGATRGFDRTHAPLSLAWHDGSCEHLRTAAKALRSSGGQQVQQQHGARDFEASHRIVWQGQDGACGHFQLRCRPMHYLMKRDWPKTLGLVRMRNCTPHKPGIAPLTLVC